MSSKFSSSFFKKSPLSVSVATGYVSTRDSLQRMFDDISKGTSKAIEDPKTGVETITTKSDKELTNREEKKVKRLRKRVKNIKDKNTNILTPRKKKAQDKADSDMTKKLEQYEALYDLKNPDGITLEERKKRVKDSYISTYGQEAWDNLKEEGQEAQYDKRIQYVRNKK